ncbi:hypothetical protein [Mycetocola sp.]|uniref:DUF7715 family protein n=1 Tax=Mycetocola sp. TaxID=1871042 RepID=UPI002601A259|nr:hypothetical protein [Mycetocola sp.]
MNLSIPMEDIMKVLVAPPIQHDADGYINSLAVAGELVIDPGVCPCGESDCEEDGVFLGAASGQPTMLAVVADLAFLTAKQFQQIVRGGCCKECAANGTADKMAIHSRFTANRWPVGSVLGRRAGHAFVVSLGVEGG